MSKHTYGFPSYTPKGDRFQPLADDFNPDILAKRAHTKGIKPFEMLGIWIDEKIVEYAKEGKRFNFDSNSMHLALFNLNISPWQAKGIL